MFHMVKKPCRLALTISCKNRLASALMQVCNHEFRLVEITVDQQLTLAQSASEKFVADAVVISPKIRHAFVGLLQTHHVCSRGPPLFLCHPPMLNPSTLTRFGQWKIGNIAGGEQALNAHSSHKGVHTQ